MIENYDIYAYSERLHMNASFCMICAWIVNFTCFYIKSEDGGKGNAFSLFGALLFMERKKGYRNSKKKVQFIEMVP